MPAFNDKDARYYVDVIKKQLFGSAIWGSELANVANALMMYVDERLPVETKPARWVNWYTKDGAYGTRGRSDMIYDDRVEAFVGDLIKKGATSITIGDVFQKEVR